MQRTNIAPIDNTQSSLSSSQPLSTGIDENYNDEKLPLSTVTK